MWRSLRPGSLLSLPPPSCLPHLWTDPLVTSGSFSSWNRFGCLLTQELHMLSLLPRNIFPTLSHSFSFVVVSNDIVCVLMSHSLVWITVVRLLGTGTETVKPHHYFWKCGFGGHYVIDGYWMNVVTPSGGGEISSTDFHFFLPSFICAMIAIS